MQGHRTLQKIALAEHKEAECLIRAA